MDGPDLKGVAVNKNLESATESALCGGILVALLWGIGVSLRGFVLGPQEITWAQWMTQLLAGMATGLLLPPALTRALVRGTAWVLARIDARRMAKAS
jgi:hypothetical protein